MIVMIVNMFVIVMTSFLSDKHVIVLIFIIVWALHPCDNASRWRLRLIWDGNYPAFSLFFLLFALGMLVWCLFIDSDFAMFTNNFSFILGLLLFKDRTKGGKKLLGALFIIIVIRVWIRVIRIWIRRWWFLVFRWFPFLLVLLILLAPNFWWRRAWAYINGIRVWKVRAWGSTFCLSLSRLFNNDLA